MIYALLTNNNQHEFILLSLIEPRYLAVVNNGSIKTAKKKFDYFELLIQ